MTSAIPENIETRLFINNEFVESSAKRTFDLLSPTSHKLVAKVHEATEQDVDRAVAAAKAAFPAWSALSPKERGSYFKKLSALILQNHEELATLEALSMGRPRSGFFEAFACADTFEYYSETGYEVQGTSSVNNPGFINMTVRQPYGVVAGIIPWNGPLLTFANKIAPALAVGNTVVLKSSEKAPLTSARVAALVKEAGFPPGVINVITGFGNISGAALSSHMDVRALSFTGSSHTGRLIQTAAAKSNLKRVLLELGGKSPAIIFDDADISAAVTDTQFSMKWNSGQLCMANSRIYVQDTIADKFIAEFKAKFSEITIGDPVDMQTTHGPQADEIQYKNVLRYIELGKQSGELVLGGHPIKRDSGYFIAPTVFTNTPEGAQIMQEEVFGSVVNINTFSTEEEVLAKANNTEFGLYAAVFTKNIDRAMKFVKALEAGTVGVNCTSPTTAIDAPFGGWKSSGVGREGRCRVSMDAYLETKSVHIKLG